MVSKANPVPLFEEDQLPTIYCLSVVEARLTHYQQVFPYMK